jgi:hypothetical protein
VRCAISDPGALSRRFLNSFSEPEIGVCTLGGFLICVDYALVLRICESCLSKEKGKLLARTEMGGTRASVELGSIETWGGVGNNQISSHFSRHCTSQMNLQLLWQLICSLIILDCCQGASPGN